MLRTATRVALPVLLAGALIALVVGSAAIGARAIPFEEAWRVLVSPDDSVASIVVWELRVPRTLLGLVVGVALGIAGILMQGMVRNPLAEPGLLGVNAGASVAVVLAISVFGVSSASGYVWFALVGAALAALIVLVVAGAERATSPITLVLAGVALAACLGSVTGIITMFDSEAFDSYRFWVVGSLAGRDLDVLLAVLPFTCVGLCLALILPRALDALALGEEAGAALGVPVRRTMTLAFAATVLLAGSATAAAGPIAFVGLVVPHALRLVVGPRHGALLLNALLAGPVLVLGADILGRIVLRPGELDVGIVTAAIGGPVLLALVHRYRKRRA